MRLKRRTSSVLDEREMQELYRIEHAGLWMMYALLCAATLVQLAMGAGPIQLAGEVCVIGVVSIVMMIAYARRGIWDAHARPSTRDNAVYAAQSALVVGVIVLGLTRRLLWAGALAVVMFGLSDMLLTILMLYVRHRQQAQAETLDDE